MCNKSSVGDAGGAESPPGTRSLKGVPSLWQQGCLKWCILVGSDGCFSSDESYHKPLAPWPKPGIAFMRCDMKIRKE